MSNKDDNSLDILGVKPIGEAINTVVKGTVEGAAAFLGRICLPAAEEFGLFLRDKVSNWRTKNLVKMTENAKKFASPLGLVQAEEFQIPLEELQKISGVLDVHRLDRELDHLRALELIWTGLDFHSATADITPSALALYLYVRGQGSLQSPV